MPTTPADVKKSMNELIAGLQKQLDDIGGDMFALLPDFTPKYSPAERNELNNLRAKLAQEIFHRQVVAAFDEASVQVINQPTKEEVQELRDTLTRLARPLDQLTGLRMIVAFVETGMTDTVNQFHILLGLLKPTSTG